MQFAFNCSLHITTRNVCCVLIRHARPVHKQGCSENKILCHSLRFPAEGFRCLRRSVGSIRFVSRSYSGCFWPITWCFARIGAFRQNGLYCLRVFNQGNGQDAEWSSHKSTRGSLSPRGGWCFLVISYKWFLLPTVRGQGSQNFHCINKIMQEMCGFWQEVWILLCNAPFSGPEHYVVETEMCVWHLGQDAVLLHPIQKEAQGDHAKGRLGHCTHSHFPHCSASCLFCS